MAPIIVPIHPYIFSVLGLGLSNSPGMKIPFNNAPISHLPRNPPINITTNPII